MTDVSGDRLVPQSLELEQQVLGEMFEYRAVAEWACGNLVPDDWYREAHQQIFAAMREVYGREGILTPAMTVVELQVRGEAGGLTDYVRYLMGVEMDTADRLRLALEWGRGPAGAIAGAKKLRELAALRRLGRLGSELYDDGFKEPWDLGATLAKAQEDIRRIAESASMGHRTDPVGDLQDGFAAGLEALRSLESGVQGMRFGIGELDSLTGGLRGQLLVVLKGQSGFGKTTLAGQAVFASCEAHMDGTGGPVLVYMLEDSREALLRRWVQWSGSVTAQALRPGGKRQTRTGEEERIAAAVERLRELPLQITDSVRDIGAIEADVRNARMNGPVLGVLIDYAQLVTGGKGDTREQKLADIAYRLVGLAAECETTIILPSQVTVQQDGRHTEKHAQALREAATLAVEIGRGTGARGETVAEKLASADVVLACDKYRDGAPWGVMACKADWATRRIYGNREWQELQAAERAAHTHKREEDVFDARGY